MRLMIAGANGAIGRQLVPLVVEQGYEVYALSRTSAGTARLDEEGAVGVQGDVLNAAELSALVAAIARGSDQSGRRSRRSRVRREWAGPARPTSFELMTAELRGQPAGFRQRTVTDVMPAKLGSIPIQPNSGGSAVPPDVSFTSSPVSATAAPSTNIVVAARRAQLFPV